MAASAKSPESALRAKRGAFDSILAGEDPFLVELGSDAVPLAASFSRPVPIAELEEARASAPVQKTHVTPGSPLVGRNEAELAVVDARLASAAAADLESAGSSQLQSAASQDFGKLDMACSTAIRELLPSLESLARWLPKTKDTSPVTLSFAGEASAVGTDTVADGDMFARLVDHGAVTVGYGAAKFSAAAETTGGDTAFASAFSDAFVSGADFVLTWTWHRSLQLHSDGGQFAQDSSATFAIAIDFEGWDLRRGPIVIDGNTEKSFAGELEWLPDLLAPGNVATFDVDVQVKGENTYADVATSVLAVEDRLSFVTAVADLAVA